eukprot:6184467-Pleurochrysis_carterae.AAC.1
MVRAPCCVYVCVKAAQEPVHAAVHLLTHAHTQKRNGNTCARKHTRRGVQTRALRPAHSGLRVNCAKTSVRKCADTSWMAPSRSRAKLLSKRKCARLQEC